MTGFVGDRIDDVVRVKLSSLGFDRVRPRRWVSKNPEPIRRIFEFQALKGGIYSARWGFSLDFVPAWRGGNLRWKRTIKNVEFDLCIDPVDEAGLVPAWCSLPNLPGSSEAEDKQITRIASDATNEAWLDFARIISVRDLIALFQERSRTRFKRFSLENYVQTHIAWGLGLLAIERTMEGEEHIRLFCDRFGLDRKDPLLREAEIEANRYASSLAP